MAKAETFHLLNLTCSQTCFGKTTCLVPEIHWSGEVDEKSSNLQQNSTSQIFWLRNLRTCSTDELPDEIESTSPYKDPVSLSYWDVLEAKVIEILGGGHWSRHLSFHFLSSILLSISAFWFRSVAKWEARVGKISQDGLAWSPSPWMRSYPSLWSNTILVKSRF